MHAEFLQDLAIVMTVAGMVTILFRVMGQPVVLGYILAGLIVGPFTPSIPLAVHDRHTVEIMSELGVILLMFSLGLHFSLRKLAAVGAAAFVAASLEIMLMVALGYAIGRVFGWSPMDSLFLGAILSISSTTIIVKALEELGRTKERFAHLIFGILIVEDILAIAMLALLSGVATTGSLNTADVLGTLWRLGVFLVTVLIVGLLAVPPLFRYLNRFKSNEMLLITALALCFGVSLAAAHMGYSVALGAFLIGAIVAEARERGKIEDLVSPVRDMFSAVFFVAIGMLIDPHLLVQYVWPILVITLAVVIGKVVSCAVGTMLAGHDGPTSLRVGMGLAQIGEFSFIIAALGQDLKVTSPFLYPVAVMVSAITTLLTPYLIRSSDRLALILHPLVPRAVADTAAAYSRWISRPAPSNDPSRIVRRLLRRWFIQMALNLALATAIFIVAAAAARNADRWWPRALAGWSGGPNTVIWLIATLMVLPLLIVTLRKVQATGRVLSEALVGGDTANPSVQQGREAVAAVILVLGSVAVMLWLLALGGAILPPWPALIVLIVVVTVIAILYWRRFERIYGKAQITLTDIFTRPVEEHAPPAAAPLHTILQEAKLESVQIPAAAAAAGRLIRELQLRTLTGASAVGIERDGASVINPGPDEELQAGDRVLLLGESRQLAAARDLLLAGRGAR